MSIFQSGVFGGGGGVSAATVRKLLARPQRQNAIFIGTSISNQRFGSATNINSSWETMLELILGWPFDSLINFSVPGDTVAQMRTRFDAALNQTWLDSFDIAFIEPGPNSAHAATASATVIADLKYMVDTLLAAGKQVVLLTPTTSGQMTTGAKRSSQSETAKWCRDYADAMSGVILADAAAVFADSADGLPESEQAPISGDSRTHPSYGGHATIGKAAAAALAGVLLPSPSLQHRNRYNHKNYFPNPGLAGAVASGVRNFQVASGITGTGPECVSIGLSGGTFGSVAVSKTTDADSGATPMILTITNASANWARLVVRFGSTDASLGIPAQVMRHDTTWASSQSKTIGDHLLLAGDALGMLTLVALSSGDSYTTGSAPSVPAAYGDLVTDGVATWLYQKKPAPGDVLQAEVPYEITSLTGGVHMSLSLLCARTPDNSPAETWLKTYCVGFDIVSSGLPSKYFPRKGTLRTLKGTLVDPGGGISLRHVQAELVITLTAGGSATVRIPSAAIVMG